MKKAIITLSLICVGLFSINSIKDMVFAQEPQNNINKANTLEVQVKNKLSKDEYFILKKCLDYKYTTEQISEMINLGYQATFQRRKNCYIRVALWFDLEVYN